MPIDTMIKKAYDLVQKGRIEAIGDELFNVVGEHGTYTVARRIDRTVNCNCLGFVRKGRCSHSLAVLMLTQPALLRTVQKQVSKASYRAESEPRHR